MTASAPSADRSSGGIGSTLRSVFNQKRRTILLFLLPPLAIYLLFVLFPMIQAIWYGFHEWNGLGDMTWIGLENYQRALADQRFLSAMWHNFIIVLLSLLIQIPLALGLAIMLNQRVVGRWIFRLIFFAPYVLAEVIAGTLWRQIFTAGSASDQILATLGLGDLVSTRLGNPDTVLYVVFFVVTWKYFGFHMILMLAGLQAIPKELNEAASIDGANRWQSTGRITIPLLGPVIRVSVFLSIIGSLQLFDMVFVMTAGGPLFASETMAIYMFDWGFVRFQFGYGSAVAVIMFGIALVVALFYQRYVLQRDVEGAVTARGG